MYASKSRRILVVEDDALLAWELQDLLSGHGYEVVGPIGRLPILLRRLQMILPDAASEAASRSRSAVAASRPAFSIAASRNLSVAWAIVPIT
jgi:hypothetical protein